LSYLLFVSWSLLRTRKKWRCTHRHQIWLW